MLDQLSPSSLETHVKVLGLLVLASGIGGLLFASCGFCVLGGIGVASGDPAAARILPMIALGLAGVGGTLSLISTAAGVGLLNRRPWGRWLGLLDACLGLLWFPIGTMLGLYAFWVLLQKNAETYFRSELAPSALPPNPIERAPQPSATAPVAKPSGPTDDATVDWPSRAESPLAPEPPPPVDTDAPGEP